MSRVQGAPTKMNPKRALVWGSLTVDCPWAPEGLATPVGGGGGGGIVGL